MSFINIIDTATETESKIDEVDVPVIKKKKGRPEKAPLDFSTLKDAEHVDEYEFASPFVISCAVCGSTKDVGFFKGGNICLKCIKTIKMKYRKTAVN